MTIKYLINQNLKGRTLIFDLDNTLYNENEFLKNRYKCISKNLSNNENESKDIYRFLLESFKKKGRKKLFDKLLKSMPHIKINKEDMIEIMRSKLPKASIQLHDWFKNYLCESLDEINIITNGNPIQQKNKIECLFHNTRSHLNVIYANELRPKPYPDSFIAFDKKYKAKKPIYIGDSLIDKHFCKNAKIEFFDAKHLM